MPLNLSFTHLAVVAVVALVVLGPERLPDVARTAGGVYREWKRIRGELEGEVRQVVDELREPFREQFEGINQTVRDVVDDIKDVKGPADPDPPPVGAIVVPPLAAALPTLAPSTGLVSPGPDVRPELPSLAPPADPDTFVPFEPPGA